MGVDVGALDCTSDPNNTFCTDPDATSRIVCYEPNTIGSYVSAN